MHLITIAHLGEAQGVIDLFDLKKTSPHVYQGQGITCLITGEGPFEAATLTASELAQNSYRSVINLGIAGALGSQLEIGQICSVRSVYLVIDGKPQFKTFKSFDTGLDCITSFERVLSAQKALPLTGVAHMVDREAWGVAMAAKSANVNFCSYKLISDQAGTLGACEIVKEKATLWSQQLAEHLKSVLKTSETPTSQMELPGFHFTFSTRHQFQQMLKKISLREELSTQEVLKFLPLDVLRSETLLPKERTKILLQHMEAKLDPMKTKLNEGLESWKAKFCDQGIQLQTDSTWESPEVRINFAVVTNEELKQKINILKDLDLKTFQDLRNGKSHVE